MSDLNDLARQLRAHVEFLASAPRPPNSPHHGAAADYITEHLSRAGFTVDIVRQLSFGSHCTNLLTRPFPDRPDLPLFLVGAHYDSISGSAGADDNASAVAALLELATWLGERREQFRSPGCRLQLVAYDLEESGLLGSALHSRQLRAAGASLYGMISLEMLGYIDERPDSQRMPPDLKGLYPDVGNFIGVCANEASRDLLKTVVAGMTSVPGLPVEHLAVPGNGAGVPGVRLSDHSSFWDENYPALMITDTAFFRNPHYHRASDRPETLNYPFLTRVTQGVCEAVRLALS